MFKFRNVDNIRDFLIQSCGEDLIVKTELDSIIKLTQNGDDMYVNLTNGEIIWEPLDSQNVFHSKLSLRIHQWFGKGIIITIN